MFWGSYFGDMDEDPFADAAVSRAMNVAGPSRLLVAGLAAGLLLNAFFLLGGFVSPPKNPDAPQVLFIVWLIGGPFVVGVWNLSAILSRRERA